MSSEQLRDDYEKGKQVITLSVIIVTLLGFVFDAATYYTLYSRIQIIVQSSSVLLVGASLVLYLTHPKKNYRVTFGIVSYTVIINIAFTAFIIHTFTSFKNFTEANILSRDLFFIFLCIALAGFVLGRKHIFIMGALLLLLFFDFIFIKKEIFFIQNAAIYLVISTGFLFVLHFLVRTLERLVTGLEDSNNLNKELKHSESEKKLSLLRYQNTLLGLVKDTALFNGEVELVYKQVCRLIAAELPTSRVSIWSLQENNFMLTRKFLFEAGVENTDPVSLYRKDFPNYFSCLDESPFILALDACHDSATKEFKETYLQPQSIVSMLDCPILMNGKVTGVICCENQHTAASWGTEEVLFIQSMAENISICYKNSEINFLLEQLRIRNIELTEKTNEIETINEELLSVNESLEETVKKRTVELETQNRQLTEYAFINSHVLRAPLARILGLSYLITSRVSINEKELMDALITASQELDVIIRKISDLLYDGNNLSREDIKTMIDRSLYNKINSKD